MASTFVAEVTQTQRFFPLAKWGAKRLPTDRPEWADRSGKHPQTKDSVESALPRECEWTAEWEIFVKDGETDKDGWQYALDFPQTFSPKMGTMDFVRRRFWRRRGQVKKLFQDKGVANCPSFEACLYHDAAELQALQELSRKQCRGCLACFTFLGGTRSCGKCAHVFCAKCCKKPAGGVEGSPSMCDGCTAEDIERRMKELQHSTGATNELESQLRATLIADEAHQFLELVDRHVTQWAAVLDRAERMGSTKNIKEKNAILEKYSKSSEPRHVCVEISILNATNVPEGNWQRRLRAAVKFPNDNNIYGSRLVNTSKDVEFLDFHTQALLSDDTQPIILQVQEHNPKLFDVSLAGVSEVGTPVMVATLNIRAAFPSKVQEVSDNFVYYERGIAVLDCVDGSKSPKPIPGGTITVKWVAEIREVVAVGFCKNCGRSEKKCKCSEQDKK